MRAKHTALVLTAGFLLIPTLTWSQFPGGGGTPGGAGGFSPDFLFDRYAQGKDVLRRAEMDERGQRMFDRFAPAMGITNGELTRAQFREAFEKGRQMIASGQVPGGMSFGGAPGGGVSPMGGAPMATGPQAAPPMDGDRRMEEYFKRMDKNEDGVLQYDEMSETLQAERDKYDANHDGVIDLTEFKAYVTARFAPAAGGGNNPGGPAGPPAPAEDERKRPTIIRGGNLPKDFPYAQLDTDVDGQVGLYEWKSAGKKVSEFLVMDLNNDGFLTVDEYYRWKKAGDEEAKKSGSQSGEFARGGRGGPGMFAMGGAGMPGGGRGGMGMGTMGPGGPAGPGMMGMGGGSGMPMGGMGMGLGGDLGSRGPGGPGMGAMGGGDRGSGGPGGPTRGFGGDRGSRGPGGDRGTFTPPGGAPAAPAGGFTPPAAPGGDRTTGGPGGGRFRTGGGTNEGTPQGGGGRGRGGR